MTLWRYRNVFNYYYYFLFLTWCWWQWLIIRFIVWLRDTFLLQVNAINIVLISFTAVIFHAKLPALHQSFTYLMVVVQGTMFVVQAVTVSILRRGRGLSCATRCCRTIQLQTLSKVSFLSYFQLVLLLILLRNQEVWARAEEHSMDNMVREAKLAYSVGTYHSMIVILFLHQALMLPSPSSSILGCCLYFQIVFEAHCFHVLLQISFPCILWSTYSSSSISMPAWQCVCLIACPSQFRLILCICTSTGSWPVSIGLHLLFLSGQVRYDAEVINTLHCTCLLSAVWVVDFKMWFYSFCYMLSFIHSNRLSSHSHCQPSSLESNLI